MSELVRMKALRSWRNDEFEGVVSFGREFMATESRARELERAELATRMAALAGQTVEVRADPPRAPQYPFVPTKRGPGRPRKVV